MNNQTELVRNYIFVWIVCQKHPFKVAGACEIWSVFPQTCFVFSTVRPYTSNFTVLRVSLSLSGEQSQSCCKQTGIFRGECSQSSLRSLKSACCLVSASATRNPHKQCKASFALTACNVECNCLNWQNLYPIINMQHREIVRNKKKSLHDDDDGDDACWSLSEAGRVRRWWWKLQVFNDN